MTAPTERQTQILEWIRAFIAREGFSPTLREIMAGIAIRSVNGMRDHLRLMRKKGLVTWKERQPRTLRLLDSGHASNANKKVRPGSI